MFPEKICISLHSMLVKVSVKRSISVLRLSGKSLSPYNKICIRNSFERSVCPSGRNKVETPARRSLRGTSRAEQQKVLRILHAIVGRAHWVHSITEVV